MRHPLLDERAAGLLEAVVDGLDDGLVIAAGDGTILHVNPAAERLLGRAAADLAGHRVDDLGRDRLAGRLAREALERAGAVAAVQGDGSRALLISARPLPGGRVVLVLRDVSETSRLMTRLQRTGERARQDLGDPAPAAAGAGRRRRLIAGSESLRRLQEVAGRYAAVDLPVLLLGETGTGKGLFAELIHQASERRRGPFLEINCGAIPEPLMEAELFGYARGAFTGADARGKVGLLELAEGGTLLLDEIGDLPPALQVKLLRFLEVGEVRPVGAVRSRRLDVRLIAATHRDLGALIAGGAFRADLYYRLNVLTVRLPPLREHPEDIPPLVEMMLQDVGRRLRRPLRITPAAVERLGRHAFPGNVRELWNVVERLGVGAADGAIDVADLPPDVAAATADPAAGRRGPGGLKEAVRSLEAAMLREALARHGSQERAARHLGVGQATVARKAKRYGLSWAPVTGASTSRAAAPGARPAAARPATPGAGRRRRDRGAP